MYTRLLSRSGLSGLAPALRAQSPLPTTLTTTTSALRAFSVTAPRPFRPAGRLYAASPVAGKPASEDVKDMAKNAVEEGQGVLSRPTSFFEFTRRGITLIVPADVTLQALFEPSPVRSWAKRTT